MISPEMRASCHDCSAGIGEPHDDDCDVAICPTCGRQVLTHDDSDHEPPPTYWTGFWPGVIECRERGWYVTGPPWQSVPPGTPGATEDLNRWAYFRQTGRDDLYARRDDG